MRSTKPQWVRGFSLLEMVVAMAILALALTVLYQAVGGATRNVRTDEKYAYAVELARSLLASNATVPAQGINVSGETASGTFYWSARSTPAVRSSQVLPPGLLHDLTLSVSWQDGARKRSVVLHTVVVGAK